ncbi:MAG: hypothetical protein R2813_07645 [Flavobacteriales bacterium]
MKQIILSVLMVFTTSVAVMAQKTQDVVHLNNGSMIRGTIIEKMIDDHVKIQTIDGSIWVFPMTDIKEIGETEAAPFTGRTPFSAPNKGFYNASSAGLLFGSNDYSTEVAVSAYTVNGYRFNPHLAAGLGVGIESFYPGMVPVFVEGRYDILESRFSPFATIQAGYGVPFQNNKVDGQWVNRGGVMLDCQVGIRNYVSNNIGFTLSAGYRHQQSVYREYYWWFSDPGDQAMIRQQYNRLVVRVGLLFN